jgi:WD40 repeat protein
MQLLSTGADGLMKLWTIRSDSCVATYDTSEDRVWALALGEDEQQAVTGSADGTLSFWCAQAVFKRLLATHSTVGERRGPLSPSIEAFSSCLRSGFGSDDYIMGLIPQFAADPRLF